MHRFAKCNYWQERKSWTDRTRSGRSSHERLDLYGKHDHIFVFLKDNSFLPPDIIMSVYNHTPADDLAIATIRTLAVDTVGKANSGHPG
jgi:hypothetical protein